MPGKNVELSHKDSLLKLVDADSTGTIDAQEFAVLYDAIKKDLAEDLENKAALEKEASSATRRFKTLLLFVAVLVSFLAASVAANFAVLFTFVDSAITTATTGTGLLEVKGSDTIVKTAIATQDVPLIVAPVLDLDTLSEVKTVKVVYSTLNSERIEAQLTVVGVRKHNSTFVEFVTSVPGETVQTLNGVAELVRYPSSANGLTHPMKHAICSANATCSALRVGGIDVTAVLEQARAELDRGGFHTAARRLAPQVDPSNCLPGMWSFAACSIFGGLPCPTPGLRDVLVYYYSGYLWTAVRHVVFMLHGWGGNAGYMWSVYCTWGWFTCPAIELPSFRHLAFVFPSSNLMGYYDGDWAMAWSTYLESTSTFQAGGAILSALMCGNPNAWSIGYCFGYGFLRLFGIGPSSEAMIFGFSNGGGMAEFANWAYGAIVTKGVAVDFHAGDDTSSWVPTFYATSNAQNFNCKIYYNCDSWVFNDVGINLIRSYAGLTSSSGQYTAGYGGWGYGYMKYREWTWTNPSDGRFLTYAVHGWDSSFLCSPNYQIMCPGCTGEEAHMTVPYFVDLVGDVLDWLGDPETSPSPPPSPPSPPSPAPPPFRPVADWFKPKPQPLPELPVVPAPIGDIIEDVPWEPVTQVSTILVCKKVEPHKRRQLRGKECPVKGDVNQNRRFDFKDIQLLTDVLNGQYDIDPTDALMPCGDFNEDERVDDLDLEAMLKAFNGETCQLLGDVNKDGTFNEEDLAYFDMAMSGQLDGHPEELLLPCGDVNGNGKPDESDYKQMKEAFRAGTGLGGGSCAGKMKGDVNMDGKFTVEDVHYFDTALHGELGDPMEVLMPCGDFDMDGVPTPMDIDMMKQALEHGEWPHGPSVRAHNEHLVDVYTQQALQNGWVTTDIETGEASYNLRQSREEAMSETWVAAPAAPPPPPISECEEQVVTVNAPKEAMYYDDAKQKRLQIRLDSILGKRETFEVLAETRVTDAAVPMAYSIIDGATII